MTIQLSPYWRITTIFMWALAGFILIGVFLFHACLGSGKVMWPIVLSGIFGIALTFLLPLMRWKALLSVELTDKTITSYYFGKEKCAISTEKEIYYSFFEDTVALCRTNKCILVSNELFSPLEPDVPHMLFFDAETQIAIPYDEKTMPFIKMDEWHYIAPAN